MNYIQSLAACAVTAALMIVLNARAQPPHEDPDVADWIADLKFFFHEVELHHKSPYFHTPRQILDARRQQYVMNLPALTKAQRVIEFAKLVALVGDGHTWMPLHPLPIHGSPPGPSFRVLPVRFELFDDGLFVVGAMTNLKDLLGARIVGIGRQPADEAVKRVMELLPQDARNFSRELVPEWLMLGDVLAATGISPDPGSIALQLQSGNKQWWVVVSVLPSDTRYDWIYSMDGGPSDDRGNRLDWMTSARKKAMWQERFAGFWRVANVGGAVYLQIDEIRSRGALGLDAAAREAGASARRANSKGLVLDLRRCPGGDGSLVPDFIAELARQGWNRATGHIAVLTSRQTHSACIMLVSALEKHTKAMFFGQATADRPNHYGETNIVSLPRHKHPVLYASEYYQTSDVNDFRMFREPDRFVPYLHSDHEQGRDPVLEAALHQMQDNLQ